MPRIALFFEYPTLLGGERSLLAAVERLRDRFEFVAFAPSQGPLAEALRENDIEIVSSPLLNDCGERLPRWRAASQLVEAARSCRADLLHANSLSMGRLTGSIASRAVIPCTAHLRDIIGLSKAAIAELNENARLIAVSEATRAFHIEQGLDAAKINVVYNGVDFDRFRPRSRSPHVRRELGIRDDALVALTVGQIGLRKGWDVFADAAARLARRWPTLHVIFVGERFATKAETVEYEQSVREQFEIAMPGLFHFLGTRNDVPDLMNAADLLVHPARQEPFGRVLLEAAASALPIIATNVGGTPEMLEDGVSARLIPPGDATALVNAVQELLCDAKVRHRLAREARTRIAERFTADRAAKALAMVWEDVLSEPRPSGSE
jgi:glycosyltransferase involved in cell wall biosynthesis